MTDTWAQRFNMTHVPAGSATGGQFGTSGGGSSAKPAAKAPAKAPAKAAPAHHMSAAHAAEKAALLAQAHKDAQEAAALEKQLAGLEKQAATAAAAAKKSAASAKAAAKAGHVVHHRKHAAHHKHHASHHASLKQRIITLKGQIRTLREKAAGLEKQANAIRSAGQVTNPGGTEKLHEYWVRGPGAAKIRWGEPDDFRRCVDHLGKYIADPEGYCNLAHKAATGMYPATHAAMDKHAGRAAMTVTAERAEMKAASINDLPDDAFAYIEPGGTKDASGRTIPRSLRHFPVHDRAHAANALSRAPQSPFGDKAMPKIKAAAKKFGIDVSSDSNGSASRAEYMRMYPLEDIHILTRAEGDGSGRVVEAYATVFDQEAEIHDHQGHYREVIDRTAFDQVLQHITRTPGGLAAQVKVLFNHGRTIGGAEAPEFQLPLGKPLDVRPEARGLLTRTEYDTSDPFTERILSKIHAGTITAQSFIGGIIRSAPELRGPGDRYRARNGALTTVRRMMLGLREYGPVLYPAYSGAEILGVRMQLSGSSEEDVPDSPEDEEYAPDMDGDGTGGTPEDVTSARYHQHALYRMTSEEARKKVGLVW